MVCQHPCDCFVLICTYRSVKRDQDAVSRLIAAMFVGGIDTHGADQIRMLDIVLDGIPQVSLWSIRIQSDKLPAFHITVPALSLFQMSAHEAADVLYLVLCFLSHLHILGMGFRCGHAL